MKAKDEKSVRRALTFDTDLYDYIEKMAGAREEPFATVCASILREVMNDDTAAESKKL